MPTQKEMSLASIVKFGVGPRGDGDIPSDLKEQLNGTEYNIQMGMTGRFIIKEVSGITINITI